MKILGIDSSGTVASVALVDGEITIAEYTVNYKKTHSETLLPMIDEIVRMTETELSTIDAIAVASGPGSFTGLRIGSATAKGLGMAYEIPIIPVPTCQALAYNLVSDNRAIICPIMDARRNQVYTGIYRVEAGRLVTLQEQMAVDIHALLEILTSYNNEVIFAGDGVPVFRETIDEVFHIEHSYAPAHLNRQRATTVATLGAIRYAEGCYESADEHVPVYLRKSQAEREYEAQKGN